MYAHKSFDFECRYHAFFVLLSLLVFSCHLVYRTQVLPISTFVLFRLDFRAFLMPPANLLVIVYVYVSVRVYRCECVCVCMCVCMFMYVCANIWGLFLIGSISMWFFYCLFFFLGCTHLTIHTHTQRQTDTHLLFYLNVAYALIVSLIHNIFARITWPQIQFETNS